MNGFVLSQTKSSGIAKAIRLGSTNLLVDDANTRVIPVDKIIVHPDYTPRKRYNDIALIRLTSKVEFNDFIWPACINIDPNNTSWLSVTAIGFGVTSLGNWARITLICVRVVSNTKDLCRIVSLITDNSIGSNELLKVRLHSIPYAECRKYFQVDGFKQDAESKTPHTNLCSVKL